MTSDHERRAEDSESDESTSFGTDDELDRDEEEEEDSNPFYRLNDITLKIPRPYEENKGNIANLFVIQDKEENSKQDSSENLEEMDVSRENSNSNLNSNQKTSKSSKSFRFGLAELADETPLPQTKSHSAPIRTKPLQKQDSLFSGGSVIKNNKLCPKQKNMNSSSPSSSTNSILSSIIKVKKLKKQPLNLRIRSPPTNSNFQLERKRNSPIIHRRTLDTSEKQLIEGGPAAISELLKDKYW